MCIFVLSKQARLQAPGQHDEKHDLFVEFSDRPLNNAVWPMLRACITPLHDTLLTTHYPAATHCNDTLGDDTLRLDIHFVFAMKDMVFSWTVRGVAMGFGKKKREGQPGCGLFTGHH